MSLSVLQFCPEKFPELVAVGMATGLQLGVDEFVVDLDFKASAARGDKFPRGDLGFKLFDQVCRDTHDTRGVVSSGAVFNRDFDHGITPYRDACDG